jgi:endonuclease IV
MPVGFHVNKAKSVHGKSRGGSIVDALEEDVAVLTGYGFAPCAQIFVRGPRTFAETLTAADRVKCRQFVQRTGTTLVVHGAYPDNPWKRLPAAINNIKEEMICADQIGATGVIVHLAAGALDAATVAHVLQEIATLPEGVKASTTLWLETHTAKASPATYETVEKLQALFQRVAAAGTNLRVGLCIDTAHLFACGLDLTEFHTAYEWFDQLQTALPDVPMMLHLNDSASTLGSGKDEHALLTHGNMWGAFHEVRPVDESGLMAVMDWAEGHGITTILERHDDVTSDLSLIRGMGYFQY